ncbi:MAG: DUF4126 domain-containing protein [Actinobacteria bacterium HGW-Actinobacteria-10]|jgi:uncharacterized membrane protein|nr:MAG: DUF4126 domain-containing protein [Actinobacteria bacterium HGW-Actinobacteria-10]
MELLTGLGLAIPAGLNAYIPLLSVAVAQQFGWIQLEGRFALIGEWWSIALIGVLLLVEIVADKVPAVDTVNDAIQTFVRPAAGGLLVAAAGAGNDFVHPVVWVVAGVLLAGGVHAAKATSRPAVNVTTAGTGAPLVSTVEDLSALAMSIAAIAVPVLAVLALLGVVVLIVWRRGRLRRAA